MRCASLGNGQLASLFYRVTGGSKLLFSPQAVSTCNLYSVTAPHFSGRRISSTRLKHKNHIWLNKNLDNLRELCPSPCLQSNSSMLNKLPMGEGGGVWEVILLHKPLLFVCCFGFWARSLYKEGKKSSLVKWAQEKLHHGVWVLKCLK